MSSSLGLEFGYTLLSRRHSAALFDPTDDGLSDRLDFKYSVHERQRRVNYNHID